MLSQYVFAFRTLPPNDGSTLFLFVFVIPLGRHIITMTNSLLLIN